MDGKYNLHQTIPSFMLDNQNNKHFIEQIKATTKEKILRDFLIKLEPGITYTIKYKEEYLPPSYFYDGEYYAGLDIGIVDRIPVTEFYYEPSFDAYRPPTLKESLRIIWEAIWPKQFTATQVRRDIKKFNE